MRNEPTITRSRGECNFLREFVIPSGDIFEIPINERHDLANVCGCYRREGARSTWPFCTGNIYCIIQMSALSLVLLLLLVSTSRILLQKCAARYLGRNKFQHESVYESCCCKIRARHVWKLESEGINICSTVHALSLPRLRIRLPRYAGDPSDGGWSKGDATRVSIWVTAGCTRRSLGYPRHWPTGIPARRAFFPHWHACIHLSSLPSDFSERDESSLFP